MEPESALHRRVHELEREVGRIQAARRGMRRVAFGTLVIVGVAFGARATAQLVTFYVNEPALASEINGNFTQLKTWLEAKVGSTSSSDVTMTGTASAAHLNTSGTVTSTINGVAMRVRNKGTLQAGNAGGTYETFMWPRWDDNILYMNYGSAGMRLRNNGGTTKLEFDNTGNATFSNNLEYEGNFRGWSITDEVACNSPSNSPCNLSLSASDGFCFITKMFIDHNSCDPYPMRCEVYIDASNNWQLAISESSSNCSTDADCTARCVNF